jgi:hydrogenase-4 membrane subunit HyfE
VRYPWLLFFAVLGASFVLAQVLIDFWDLEKARLAMAGLQALAGIWVFLDALRERLPRPLRWGMLTLLLTVFLLPWYLARRRAPHSPVPFVEVEVRPAFRLLAFALAVFFLLSVILYFVQGPQAK